MSFTASWLLASLFFAAAAARAAPSPATQPQFLLPASAEEKEERIALLDPTAPTAKAKSSRGMNTRRFVRAEAEDGSSGHDDKVEVEADEIAADGAVKISSRTSAGSGVITSSRTRTNTIPDGGEGEYRGSDLPRSDATRRDDRPRKRQLTVLQGLYRRVADAAIDSLGQQERRQALRESMVVQRRRDQRFQGLSVGRASKSEVASSGRLGTDPVSNATTIESYCVSHGQSTDGEAGGEACKEACMTYHEQCFGAEADTAVEGLQAEDLDQMCSGDCSSAGEAYASACTSAEYNAADLRSNCEEYSELETTLMEWVMIGVGIFVAMLACSCLMCFLMCYSYFECVMQIVCLPIKLLRCFTG